MNITRHILHATRMSFIQKANCSKLPPELVFPLTNKMIVCWHPEKEFPYEHSRPLPKKTKTVYTESILHMSKEKADALLVNRTEQQSAEYLAKITYTTKHRWFPRSRDKKAKKTEPDRPYL